MGACNSKWEQRWGDKMVSTTKPSFPVICVSTTPNTYRRRLATVCWTWIRWALCPQNGACARCRGRARRWRTPGASHTTADRRGLWCHPQSVYPHRNIDTQKNNKTKQKWSGVSKGMHMLVLLWWQRDNACCTDFNFSVQSPNNNNALQGEKPAQKNRNKKKNMFFLPRNTD